MENTSSIAGNFSTLLPRLAKIKASLMSRLMPGWTNNKIEAMLFVPGVRDARPARLPRGFQQFDIITGSGNIMGYATGNGPTVVFVHGWGGAASQFFPLMHGLSQCGFRALAFDHFGHAQSEQKPATLKQSIITTNQVLKQVKGHSDGLCAVVGHSTGCIAIGAARNALVKDVPLFLISPVFNYKLFFLKKLGTLKLHAELVKRYAGRFMESYRGEYLHLELARNLDKYAEVTVIAHDESDNLSAISDSARFCTRYPLTRLLVTKNQDHFKIINSESVWQELKTHLNYDDTTINYTAEVVYQ